MVQVDIISLPRGYELIMLFFAKLGQTLVKYHLTLAYFSWPTFSRPLKYAPTIGSRILYWFSLFSQMEALQELKARIGITNSCWCCWCPRSVTEKEEEEEKGMSHEVKSQLHVLHDPFSGATSQPKIPDGKVNDSLGFSTQAVREHRNAVDGDGIMHMLLYAGTNGALIVSGLEDAKAAFKSADYNILGFTDSGGLDSSDLWDNTIPIPAGEKRLIRPLEQYALHRVVSCGMQLKLLNPQDEDDGWFEAVRVNENLDLTEYRLDQLNSGITQYDEAGTVAPYGLLKKLETRDITNDPTYATGLLRDLGHVQFELHGRIDYHDFRRRHEADDLVNDDLGVVDQLGRVADFAAGSDNARQIVDQYIDPTYDMVYIRLHCRANSSTGDQEQGSRLHTNVVSNQEIYYPPGERDNRYHTMSPTVGSHAASLHFQARRANRSSVKLI
jgi:hypothetical protein